MFNHVNSKEIPHRIGQYRLMNQIGRGTFGQIFAAKSELDGKKVAVKIEKPTLNQLHSEYKLYKCLWPGLGIPRVYNYHDDLAFNAMAMELLGPSLEDLFTFCSRRFSTKTVLMLAMQMIDNVEYVHMKGYLHRDIKPDNFVMGLAPNNNRLYIIDFGLAKQYCSNNKLAPSNHIPFKWGYHVTGTPRYASVNALSGYEVSRRDDMESLCYVLMYFLRGSLPWQGLTGPKEQKYEMIAEKKLSITPEELCQGFPDEFAACLNHCRSLRFAKKPNYMFVRRSFNHLFNRLRFVHDDFYDWHFVSQANDAQNESIEGTEGTKNGETNDETNDESNNENDKDNSLN